MIAILIFLGLIIGLNCIPLLTNKTFPKVEKVVIRILIASTILFIMVAIFEFNGYRLKGFYTSTILTVTFLASAILYFILFKNTIKKILTILPLTLLLLMSIFLLLAGRLVCEVQIDNKNKLSVTKGGFMACGESYHITQTKFLIFDKYIFHINDLCLLGTKKIEIIKFDNKHAEFLIYHNGEYDSENPYKLNIERKNGW